MRALVLYCGGGGGSEGLRQVGFQITGVDIQPQPHHPGQFVQANVLSLDPNWINTFDLVLASPPCQRFSRGAKQAATSRCHPDLVYTTRLLLQASNIPYVIENIPSAPLHRDLLLCGAMFGLALVRHRIFEVEGFTVPQPHHWQHASDFITVAGNPGGKSHRDGDAHFGTTSEWRTAMGIGWLPSRLLAEAIPPAYTRWIGWAFRQQERPNPAN